MSMKTELKFAEEQATNRFVNSFKITSRCEKDRIMSRLLTHAEGTTLMYRRRNHPSDHGPSELRIFHAPYDLVKEGSTEIVMNDLRSRGMHTRNLEISMCSINRIMGRVSSCFLTAKTQVVNAS